MEKKKFQIINVDKDNCMVTYLDNGQKITRTVVPPADIKFAKIGFAEVGFDEENYINFIRNEKSNTPNNFNKGFNKYKTANAYDKPKEREYAKIKVFKGLSDIELEQVYNDLAEKYTVKATQTFEDGDDKDLWKGVIYYSVLDSQLNKEEEFPDY